MPESSTLPGWPLILRRELAAAYVGLSTSTFDVEVKAGRLPRAVSITGTVRCWHRADLDAWADDRREEAGTTPNPWDEAA